MSRWIRLLALCAGVLIAYIACPASAQAAVVVSGTAMKDEIGTSWQGCDGVTANVGIAVDGVAAPPVVCSPLDGSFSFSSITIPAVGSHVVVWLDGGLAHGVLYDTAASTSANITGLTLAQDRVWVRSERAADTQSVTMLSSYDATDDPDIPVDTSSGIVLDPGTELHIDGANSFTFAPATTISATSIHAEAGATFQPNNVTVSGSGTEACNLGPSIARPLCFEAGATFTHNNSTVTYQGQTGRYTIEPLHYASLTISGAAGSVGEIGYAASQLLQLDGTLTIRSAVTSDPFAADVEAQWIYIDGWVFGSGSAGLAQWTGHSTFSITVYGSFLGGGAVDLPGASLAIDEQSGRVDFGSAGGDHGQLDWVFHDITIRNNSYNKQVFGSSGMTAPYNSGAGDDTVVGVKATLGLTYAVLRLPTGSGGDWGVIAYYPDGTPNYDWDDGDAECCTDADGNAILTFDSGGVDIPFAMEVSQGSLYVAGESGGNWMVRKYDDAGRLDTSFNGTGVLTWAGTGTDDQVRGISLEGANITLVGNSGNAGGPYVWQVRTYSQAPGALQAASVRVV